MCRTRQQLNKGHAHYGVGIAKEPQLVSDNSPALLQTQASAGAPIAAGSWKALNNARAPGPLFGPKCCRAPIGPWDPPPSALVIRVHSAPAVCRRDGLHSHY